MISTERQQREMDGERGAAFAKGHKEGYMPHSIERKLPGAIKNGSMQIQNAQQSVSDAGGKRTQADKKNWCVLGRLLITTAGLSLSVLGIEPIRTGGPKNSRGAGQTYVALPLRTLRARKYMRETVADAMYAAGKSTQNAGIWTI